MNRKLISILIAVALMISVPLWAQQNSVFDVEGEALGHQKITTAAATGFSATYLNLTGVGMPKAVLISVETAAVRFTLDGTTPAVTGGGQAGHKLSSGDSYVIRGYGNIQRARFINETASNGGVVISTFFY